MISHQFDIFQHVEIIVNILNTCKHGNVSSLFPGGGVLTALVLSSVGLDCLVTSVWIICDSLSSCNVEDSGASEWVLLLGKGRVPPVLDLFSLTPSYFNKSRKK